MHKKRPFIHHSLNVKKVNEREDIYTWSRSTVIQPYMINKKFFVHNGNSFVSLIINENMVGCKLGEFARTRKRGLDSRSK